MELPIEDMIIIEKASVWPAAREISLPELQRKSEGKSKKEEAGGRPCLEA